MADLQRAGDITIDKILITTTSGFYQDIKNQVIGIQLFEDIYSPFITGSMTILDSLDLLNLFPLVGNEYLELKMFTPTIDKAEVDGKFYIYKMSDRQPLGDRSYTYELHFISQEALLDVNKKISKSFSGKCSDIATELLSSDVHGMQLKNFIVEPTSNSTKFISNFWSPIKCINNVTDTSINKNGSASYLFYQDRYNYNFVSLESLYLGGIFQEFRYDNYVRDIDNKGLSTRNINEDYKRIRDIKMPVVYDYIDRTSSGMYGSNLYTYDITTKRIKNQLYDAKEMFKYQNHLNQFPLVSGKSVYRYNSTLLAMTKYTGNFSGFGDVTNASSIQNRISLMKQIDANKLQIIVPGRLDYTVGIRVLLTLYKNEPTRDTDVDIIDEIYSGTYLISAINHYINKSTHECTIEIVKESLLKNLDEVK